MRAQGPFKSRDSTVIGLVWVTKSLNTHLLLDSGRHPIDTCQGTAVVGWRDWKEKLLDLFETI